MFFDSSYLLYVFIPTLVITLFAQWRVKSAFNKWSRVRNQKGISGAETAELIKQRSQLAFVETKWIPGQMTDHYDPRDKSINLSESSRDASVAAMAIVAHELGHAEQDRTGYSPLRIRSALVPAANIGSKLGIWLVFGGLMLNFLLGQFGDIIAWVGVFLFAAAVLFSFVTLPVEFNASKRAKVWVRDYGLATEEEAAGVDAVLNAAALTYVAAAATSLLTLMYYIRILNR